MVDVQRINIKVCSVSIKSLRIRRFSFQIVRLTSFMSLLLPLLSAITGITSPAARTGKTTNETETWGYLLLWTGHDEFNYIHFVFLPSEQSQRKTFRSEPLQTPQLLQLVSLVVTSAWKTTAFLFMCKNADYQISFPCKKSDHSLCDRCSS